MNGDMRALYTTMMYIRYMLIYQTFTILGQGLLISLRYSAVRRQFRNISGQKEETKLLDYQTQQMKLFPMVSQMYAHAYASERIYDLYDQFCKDSLNGEFKLLDIMHHFTSGMKSVFTQECWDSLILMRQSLGGAGYSAWSGIPLIIDDYSPSTTFEGDNTVMAQ